MMGNQDCRALKEIKVIKVSKVNLESVGLRGCLGLKVLRAILDLEVSTVFEVL